jgi:hypothetical protein
VGRVIVVRVCLNVFFQNCLKPRNLAEAVTLLTSLRQEPGSNLDGDIKYPDWYFSCFYSVSRGKLRGRNFKRATTAFFSDVSLYDAREVCCCYNNNNNHHHNDHYSRASIIRNKWDRGSLISQIIRIINHAWEYPIYTKQSAITANLVYSRLYF